MNDLQKIDTQPIEIKANKWVETIKQLQINNQGDNIAAGDLLKSVKTYIKAVEQQKKDQTSPLKDQINHINNSYKYGLTLLSDCEGSIRAKINAYNDEELARREKEALELKKQAEEEAINEALKLEGLKDQASEYDSVTQKAMVNYAIHKQEEFLTPKDIKIQNLSNSSTKVSKVWDFELENIDLVPTEFLLLNEKAVREAIRSGNRDISGVKIFQKTRVGIR